MVMSQDLSGGGKGRFARWVCTEMPLTVFPWYDMSWEDGYWYV